MKRLTRGVVGAGAAAIIALALPLTLHATSPEPSPAPFHVAQAASDDDDDDDDESPPCLRTDFKSEVVKAACAKGGQFEAKAQMKKFLAAAQERLGVGEVTCNTCHSALAPTYKLTDDGLAKFEDWQRRLAVPATR